MAVASLVGSIHADAVHNHVMYYNPETGRIEPLLWDANGFGIHAEPELEEVLKKLATAVTQNVLLAGFLGMGLMMI